MGKPRYIYFEDEISKLLDKEKNKSHLINELLRKHFEKTDIKKLDLEGLKKLKREQELKQEYESKLKEINNGL